MIDTSITLSVVMLTAQIWKKQGLDHHLIPLLNIVTAIILSLVLKADLAFISRIQQGLVIGLSASGIYDVYKCFKSNEAS
ncbi:MAG: hypothetical protein FWE07_02715 [Turicibacter sp.]|nr:hypothetical protein [Turicibacter sp.]